jgi:MYXO-CTERM domain-containing protein
MATLLHAGAALATPDFPGVIQTTWKVKLPDCTLCHSDDSTSVPKHVTTLVGRWFFGDALTAYDEATLKKLLAESQQAGQDSDGDGVSDFDELKKGTDPNKRDATAPPDVAGDGGAGDAGVAVAVRGPEEQPIESASAPLLQTGCSLAAPGHLRPFSALAMLSLALLASRRRRKAPAAR